MKTLNLSLTAEYFVVSGVTGLTDYFKLFYLLFNPLSPRSALMRGACALKYTCT